MCGVVDRGDQITFVIMQVRLLFFGNLTDVMPSTMLDWDWNGDGKTVNDLLNMLYSSYPKLKGKTFRVAVNQQFVAMEFGLTSGDEVALMPPFSGG